MKTIVETYNERFCTDLDTWALRFMDAYELADRIQRALDEGTPIDLEEEYGIMPTPEDALT